MRKGIYLCLFILLFSAGVFAVGEELIYEKDLYKSITTTADYQLMPKFIPEKTKPNKLFEDIKVSAIEAIPFAVLYTSLALFVYEASSQGKFPPTMKTVDEYKQVYGIAAGSLAALSVFINVFTFYSYENKKGEKDEKKNQAQ
jgi:hypothetical protein